MDTFSHLFQLWTALFLETSQNIYFLLLSSPLLFHLISEIKTTKIDQQNYND